MFLLFENITKNRQAAKWIIGIITICILIYLSIRYIEDVAIAANWVYNLCKPILIGIILALILNVPMSAIESRLLKKIKRHKAKRTLSIVLSLVFVIICFTGIAFLVIPKLVDAIKLIAQIIMLDIDALAEFEKNLDWTSIPLGEYFSKSDVDWSEIKHQLEQWFSLQAGNTIHQLFATISSLYMGIFTAFISLAFSIYTLAQKETLKYQCSYLVKVWIPEKTANIIIHISSVSGRVFKHFIAGQAIEAVILGTLCMLGMIILQIPYAPMIGALVGVTALVPIVGAFVGAIIGALMIVTVNPIKALIFIIFLLILQQIEGNLIYPRVVGAKINLPAIWVLSAVTIGGSLAGPVGMLLGVPAASAAYVLLKEATIKREKNNAEHYQ